MRSYRPYSRWGGGVGKRYQSTTTWPPTSRNASVHIRNLPAFANEGNVLDWCRRTVCGDGATRCSDRIVRNIWMGKPVIVRDNSKEDAGQVVKRLRYAHVNFADPIYAKVMLAHADAKEYDGSSEPTVHVWKSKAVRQIERDTRHAHSHENPKCDAITKEEPSTVTPTDNSSPHVSRVENTEPCVSA